MEDYKTVKTWEPIDFTIYFKFIKWYVLLIAVLEIGFRALIINYPNSLFFEQKELVAWLLRLAIFFWLGVRLVRNFGPSAAVGAMAGFLAGFAAGLIIAIYRFFEGVAVWKFFNLIAETILVAVVGSLVAILTVYILSFKK